MKASDEGILSWGLKDEEAWQRRTAGDVPGEMVLRGARPSRGRKEGREGHLDHVIDL